MHAGSDSAPVARVGARHPRRAFRVEDIDAFPLKTRFFNWLFDYPQREWWMRLLRRWWPIFRLPSQPFLVLRDDDVRELLGRDRDFPVPWDQRMKHVTGRKNFVLGMEDGPEYRMNYAQLAKAFARDDVPRYIAPQAAAVTEAILLGRNTLDAVRELMWGVPAKLCQDYYGLEVPDPLLLADWAVVVSSYLFGSGGRPAVFKAPPADAPSEIAAAGMRELIRGSMRNARAGNARGVVLPRLLRLQKDEEQQGKVELTDAVIEAHFYGMVTGFIPTNLMAGGSILDTLLRRPDFMERTRAAALCGDDGLLWRCLQEALRFRHINPGPFRVAGANGCRLAVGTERETWFAPGTLILASTQSAMFDSARVAQPHAFDPQRPADDYLVFGYGQHWCIGAYIAIAQLTQTFKVLLRRPGLQRVRGKAGKLRRIGAYPANLHVKFAP